MGGPKKHEKPTVYHGKTEQTPPDMYHDTYIKPSSQLAGLKLAVSGSVWQLSELGPTEQTLLQGRLARIRSHTAKHV